MAGYKLSPAAEADLEAIWRYTADTWGQPQADAYIDGLIAAFARLAENPQLCRLRAEFKPPVRLYHEAHHLLVYVEREHHIVFLRVLHERMHVEEKLTE